MDLVRIKAPGWGFSTTEHEGLRVSPSTAALRVLTPIRPDDVFYVGRMTFSVHVQEMNKSMKSAEIQVTSSGHNDSTVQGILDLEGESLGESRGIDKVTELSMAVTSYHRSSTPTISSRPIAVMETPTAVRVRQSDPEPVAIMSSVDGNSVKDPPILMDATNATASDQPLVKTEMEEVKDDNEELVHHQITNLSDAADQHPSSTADEYTPHSSPTPKKEDSDSGLDLRPQNTSTIQVEIPMRRQMPTDVISSAKRRKVKSPGDLAEPTSSSRSTRSNPREDTKSENPVHSDLKIMFASSTSSDKSPQFMKFLNKQGVKTVKSVADCTILCVGKSAELKKTSNLILAVAAGKEIITDEWISRSATKGELLETYAFLAKDPKREAEWGTTLSNAIERGRQGAKPLVGYSIFFTPSARKEVGKGFSDIKEIAVFAGAECIKATVPRKGPEESPMTMVIAATDDAELPALEEKSWKAYSKEIITLSVLRGSLDLDSDEFLVGPRVASHSGRGKKRKR